MQDLLNDRSLDRRDKTVWKDSNVGMKVVNCDTLLG